MRQIPGHPLWLGHVGHARDLHPVLSAGIEAVVDLAANEPPVLVTRDIVYCRFPLHDGGGNPEWVVRAAVEAVAGFVRAGVSTLVFCSAGMSRSPAVAAGALTRVLGCAPDEALALVTADGPADVSFGLWRDVQAALS
jgi:protein-tyrosine phosphatase